MLQRSIKLATQIITDEQLERAAEWLRSGARLTKGEETLAFESEFAGLIGSRHAVFVNSGSSANLAMALALLESGRLRNRRVICPAVSWVTTISPFIQLGYEVHLCDADPLTLGLDPDHLRVLVSELDPALVITVDVLGHPNQYSDIRRICDAADAILVEDACEALGSIDARGARLGTIGEMGTFSFYYGHHMSTIEGGMVVTDNDDLAEILVAVRSHGWSRDLSTERREVLAGQWGIDPFSDLYTFYFPGLNIRATDLQARIGREQLWAVDENARLRERHFEQHRISLPRFWSQSSDTALLSSFAFGTTVEDRRMVGLILQDAGIESRPLICGNIGRHPFWLKRYGPRVLPAADAIHDFGIYLPIHSGMDSSDVEYVASVMAAKVKPGPKPAR